MFDFGLSFSHIMVIVVLAVVVIGPKDLPVVLMRLGQMMNKMRRMAREFQGHVDTAMRDAGLDNVRRDLASVATGVSAVMAPVQTAIAASALSAPAPAPAKPVSGPVPGFESATALAAPKASSGLFEEGQGETRILGKALDSQP
jgi:sec-independent protein translocase protein TatB